MKRLSIWDTSSEVAIVAAAMLCGMQTLTPAFEQWAREAEALPIGHTVGDIARQYLRDTLKSLTYQQQEDFDE
jgi:hypothetical protein